MLYNSGGRHINWSGMEQGDKRFNEADNEMVPTVGRRKQYLILYLSRTHAQTHAHH